MAGDKKIMEYNSAGVLSGLVLKRSQVPPIE